MKRTLIILSSLLVLTWCSAKITSTDSVITSSWVTLEQSWSTAASSSITSPLSLDNIALQHESRSFWKTDPFNWDKQWILWVPVQIYIKNNSNKTYSYWPVWQDSSIVVKCWNNDLYVYQVEWYDVTLAPNWLFDTSKRQWNWSSSSRMNFDCQKIFSFTNTNIQNPSLISPSLGSKSVNIECWLYQYSLNNDGSYKEHKISTLKMKTDINYTVSWNELICALN